MTTLIVKAALATTVLCAVVLSGSAEEDPIQMAAFQSSEEQQAPAENDLQLLIYETEVESQGVSPAVRLIQQADALPGVAATLFGQGQHFDGFGSKYEAVLPLLKKMEPDTLAVMSDGRDVLINNPFAGSEGAAALAGFRDAFNAVTFGHPGAIVISAEAQCCVSALTFVKPGDYYNADGTRNVRACSSGAADCLWNGDSKAEPWETFMKEVALEQVGSGAALLDDIYLNAGLMAGKVADLVRVIEAADIGAAEDDQAVLTDFMYQNPNMVVLDYGQTMFGNNRGGLEGEESCMFALASANEETSSSQRLVHTKTQSSPLFVHSPGGFLKCHDELASALGIQQVSSSSRRLLQQWKGSSNNYGGGNCGYNKKRDGSGDCVQNWCNKDFKCPTHSKRKANQNCYDNINKCECEDGYFINQWSQVQKKATNTCGEGKKLDGSGDCVKNWCNQDFKCPAQWKRKANQNCYNNINKCECKDGYFMNQWSQCQKSEAANTCGHGKKLDGSGDCVKEWCNKDFKCPVKSKRKANQNCYNNISKCECDDGYFMNDWSQCQKEFKVRTAGKWKQKNGW